MADLKLSGVAKNTPKRVEETSKAGKQFIICRLFLERSTKFSVQEFEFSSMNEDKMDIMEGIKVGDEVDVNAYLNSRKYNERFYYDLRFDSVKVTQPVDKQGKSELKTTYEISKEADFKDLPF